MSIFTQIQLSKPKRSTFNLSHNRKFSFQMGYLTPILNMDVVPADKITLATQQMLRFAPMISPVMHEVNVTNHFFSVPLRLLYADWEEFITAGKNGTSEPVFPRIVNLDTEKLGSLADYLGLPKSKAIKEPVSLLPFVAYQLIWNEYYRDQNVNDDWADQMKNSIFGFPIKSLVFDYANPTTKAEFDQFLGVLRKRAWQHDYFTSALPFAQKGEPVKIPLAGTTPVQYEANGKPSKVRLNDGTLWATAGNFDLNIGQNTGGNIPSDLQTNPGSNDINIDVSGQHYVDLGEGNSTSINDLRTAFSLQQWLEKNARAGSRYVEFLLSHFNVRSSDARLQRPEYLGGDKSPVAISEVLQTSESQNTPQANMAGHGLNVGASFTFEKYFEEHCIIIGITNVQPTTAYFQGIPKQWNKFDRFDYFFPEFENIGEQEILNKELYLQSNIALNNQTFGYIPRYAEYKYMSNTVHGDFKDTLDFWHMGRKFENLPALNAEFIDSNPTTRIFAVEDPKFGHLYAQYFLNIKAKRPMSYYSNPGISKL